MPWRKSVTPQPLPLTVRSPNVQAPEVLQPGAAGAVPVGAADVWALGVLTFKVLVGTFPFPHTARDDLTNAIEQHDVRVPRFLSVVAASFIQQALTRNAAVRPPISTLARHPWLVSRGSVVPVDLSAPEWRSLGVAPADGSGALELLSCPQGIDQAQYDGLRRVRFNRGGFHSPDIAATGPISLTPHCSFSRCALPGSLPMLCPRYPALRVVFHAGSGCAETTAHPWQRPWQTPRARRVMAAAPYTLMDTVAWRRMKPASWCGSAPFLPCCLPFVV